MKRNHARIVSDPDAVRLRVWSAAPLTEVSGRLDDGAWAPLTPLAPFEYAAPLAGERLWQAR